MDLSHGSIDWNEVARRSASTPPLRMLAETADTVDATNSVLRWQALAEVGRCDESLRALQAASRLAPDDWQIRVSTEVTEAQRSSKERAIELANELWDTAEASPDPSLAKSMAARLAMRVTRHGSASHKRAAARLAEAAAQRHADRPELFGPLLDLAIGRQESGDRAGAQQAMAELRTRGLPPLPSAWLIDASAARSWKDEARARASWRQAAELAGRSTGRWAYLAWRRGWLGFLLTYVAGFLGALLGLLWLLIPASVVSIVFLVMAVSTYPGKRQRGRRDLLLCALSVAYLYVIYWVFLD